MLYLKIKKPRLRSQLSFVPWVGIEPTLPKKLDFESSASTNSATKANIEGTKLEKYSN